MNATDYVVIREAETHKEVHRITVKNATTRKTDKVAAGVSINMDHDRFYIAIEYGKETAS